MSLKMSRTMYFTHFLLGSAWYASNVYTSLGLNSCNYCNIVPATSTRAKLVLTCATFLIVRVGGSTTFARFCSRKKYSFLCGDSFSNLIINLLSDLQPLSVNYSKNFVVILGFCFVWDEFNVLGHSDTGFRRRNITLSFVKVFFYSGFFIGLLENAQSKIAFNI